MTAPAILEGLFYRLAHEEGLPLGIRDLTDALRALEAGFGQCSRPKLLWLCQTLWARTDDERRRIAIHFERMPPPTEHEVATLTGTPPRTLKASAADRKQLGPMESPIRRDLPSLEIAEAGAAGGFGVPRARVSGCYSTEPFVLTPKPLIPLRTCIIAWRRYRTALREGPKTELDLDATIASQARRGFLDEPVLVACRRNQARVVLLIDAGSAMAPWGHSVRVLKEAAGDAGFASAVVYYFQEHPLRLYSTRRLTGPVPLQKAMDDHPETPALVVSDAGAARGRHDSARIEATRKAIVQLRPVWRPLAWLNPMPPARWRSTPAAAIGKIQGVAMLPLTPDGLIGAIDVLRGRNRQ